MTSSKTTDVMLLIVFAACVLGGPIILAPFGAG